MTYTRLWHEQLAEEIAEYIKDLVQNGLPFYNHSNTTPTNGEEDEDV